MNFPNQIFLRITVHSMLILLPLITYYGIWGSHGSLAKHEIYLKTKSKTLDRGETPCIVCGSPGQKRDYRKVGTGLSNPFDYEGPYIYCSTHTERTPMSPYTIEKDYVKKGASSLIFFAYLIIILWANIWKKIISPDEAKESWEMLGIGLILFVVFFFT